jgi:hypothetical protein
VSDSYAILIGVEESDGLPPCPFAAAEIRAFAQCLEAIGVSKSHQVLLVGSSATRSAAESRLRRLGNTLHPTDTVWFVFAGPAFSEDGRSFLVCTDTLEDDRAATAITLSDVFRLLGANGATARYILDAAGLVDDELGELFPAAGTAVALVAAAENQLAHAAAGRRLWLQLIGDALYGRVPAILDDGKLSAGALHAWTTKELPRVIRKAISVPKQQTPRLFGSEDAVLATVAPAENPPTAKLSLKLLKRIVFRGQSRNRVRDLSGFQKSFKLPESATPSAQKWIYRLAADDLRADIERTFNSVREQMGFKRKDLESSVGTDGMGFIRTPKFDYSVSVSLDPDDPSSVIWRREVSQIADPAVLRSDAFRKVLGSKLDTLQFDFAKPIDVGELVDRIEDEPPPGVNVRVASDDSSCDVTVQGFAGRIHVERASLRIEGRPGLSPDSLVEQFFAFQARFGGKAIK